jgi:hypothetical protein
MFKSYLTCTECGGFMNLALPEEIADSHASHQEGIQSSLELNRDLMRYVKGRWNFVGGTVFGCWHASHQNLDGKEFQLDKGLWVPDMGRHLFPGDLPWCFCDFRPIRGS